MNTNYKMFRNFMMNELSITKQDIELWTKEAVQDEVNKLLGGICIESMIDKFIDRKIEGGNWWSTGIKEIRGQISKELADRIALDITLKDAKQLESTERE